MTTNQNEDLIFSNNTAASRFELHRDSELLSVLDYNDNGATIALTRSFTIPSHRGHGYAAVVLEHVVEGFDANTSGTVLPVCWYVAEWFERNPEHAHLLHKPAA